MLGRKQYGDILYAKLLFARADLGLDPGADKLKDYFAGIQGDEELLKIIAKLAEKRKTMLASKTDFAYINEDGTMTESKILPNSEELTAILDELLKRTDLI